MAPQEQTPITHPDAPMAPAASATLDSTFMASVHDLAWTTVIAVYNALLCVAWFFLLH